MVTDGWVRSLNIEEFFFFFETLRSIISFRRLLVVFRKIVPIVVTIVLFLVHSIQSLLVPTISHLGSPPSLRVVMSCMVYKKSEYSFFFLNLILLQAYFPISQSLTISYHDNSFLY